SAEGTERGQTRDRPSTSPRLTEPTYLADILLTDEGAQDPGRRVCGRPRLSLRLHARLVAALEGARRGRRRPDRDAGPRARGRGALVANRAEPAVPRGRGVRGSPRRRGAAEGRPVPAPRRGESRGLGLGPARPRGDLALRHAALAASPRAH